MNLTDLATFVQVAEHGTLTAAAHELGVPKSTVSRRVSRLEDALGLPLVVRSARAIALTDNGRRLHARSGPALRELADLERDITEARGEPAGRLKLTAPPDLAHTSFFLEVLAAYRRRWPEVVIDVVLTNRVVDLVEEGFDVALRPNANTLRDAASIMGRRIAGARPGLWAGREYVARAGAPQHPRELLDHDCIGHTAFGGRALPLVEEGQEAAHEFPFRQALVVNDFSVVTELVRRGVGISALPTTTEVRRSDEFVRVLPRWSLPESSLWMVWPATRHLSPRVRAFVDLGVELTHLMTL